MTCDGEGADGVDRRNDAFIASVEKTKETKVFGGRATDLPVEGL